MKWSLHQVYFHLVCLVTLVMVIVGGIYLCQAAVTALLPSADPSPVPGPSRLQEFAGQSRLPAEVIERELERQQQYVHEVSREQAKFTILRKLARGLTLLAAAAPVYLYHWRRIPFLPG